MKPAPETANSQATMSAADKDKQAITTSVALIKKQGDYPEFWPRNNSFISAMEDIYAAVRKKNNKQLL